MLQALKLSSEQRNIVKKIVKDKKRLDWYDKRLKSIKSLIKKAHLKLQGECCCYCRRSLKRLHGAAFDTEHILPQSKYKNLVLRNTNLSVVCKTCNSQRKGNKVDFYVGSGRSARNRFLSSDYKFIHPNLDKYEEHLRLINIGIDCHSFVKYSVVCGSSKGKFTYEFFKLNLLEENELTEFQGGQKVPILSERGGEKLRDIIEELSTA